MHQPISMQASSRYRHKAPPTSLPVLFQTTREHPLLMKGQQGLLKSEVSSIQTHNAQASLTVRTRAWTNTGSCCISCLATFQLMKTWCTEAIVCAPEKVGVPEGDAPGRRAPAAPPSEGVEMGRYAKRGACGAAAITFASPAGAPRPIPGAAPCNNDLTFTLRTHFGVPLPSSSRTCMQCGQLLLLGRGAFYC